MRAIQRLTGNFWIIRDLSGIFYATLEICHFNGRGKRVTFDTNTALLLYCNISLDLGTLRLEALSVIGLVVSRYARDTHEEAYRACQE